MIVIYDLELSQQLNSLMMGTEMVVETLVSYRHLMWLMAQEDFIE
jgi:hypothetical protein